MTHSRTRIHDLLGAGGLAPRRDLGQNFVADPNTVRRIASLAAVGPGDHVVEIGAGLGSLATRGELVVDAGCKRALISGKSLLAVGVKEVRGTFGKGDTVVLLDETGADLASGLVRYDVKDLERIKGLRSGALKEALGYAGGPVVIHADDLSLRDTVVETRGPHNVRPKRAKR